LVYAELLISFYESHLFLDKFGFYIDLSIFLHDQMLFPDEPNLSTGLTKLLNQMKHSYKLNALFSVPSYILVCCLFLTMSLFPSLEMQAEDGCVTCNNVTDGGEICCDQTGNAPFDPATIYNTDTPSGGSGSIEYMWLYKSATTGWNWVEIVNNQDCYDPGSLCETTIYRRCARREYCTSWPGESNDVTITVNGSCTCNAAIDALVIYNLTTGSAHATLQNGYTYTQASLPTNWNIEALVSGSSAQSVKFTFTGDYSSNNIENALPYRSPGDAVGLNLAPGTYTLNAKGIFSG
jgi:hypothetical protein